MCCTVTYTRLMIYPLHWLNTINYGISVVSRYVRCRHGHDVCRWETTCYHEHSGTCHWSISRRIWYKGQEIQFTTCNRRWMYCNATFGSSTDATAILTFCSNNRHCHWSTSNMQVYQTNDSDIVQTRMYIHMAMLTDTTTIHLHICSWRSWQQWWLVMNRWLTVYAPPSVYRRNAQRTDCGGTRSSSLLLVRTHAMTLELHTHEYFSHIFVWDMVILRYGFNQWLPNIRDSLGLFLIA